MIMCAGTKEQQQQRTIKIAVNDSAAIIVVVHRQNGTSCSTLNKHRLKACVDWCSIAIRNTFLMRTFVTTIDTDAVKK